jgi:hypothetical protein
MATSTTNPVGYDDRGPRVEVVADGVVAAYIHAISDRHRPAARATERPANRSSEATPRNSSGAWARSGHTQAPD